MEMVRCSGLSCFIKDIDYNGISKWRGKRKKKKENEKKKKKLVRNMIVYCL